jgi:hypothetical protein
MRSFGALLLAFFASILVAGMVQNRIAIAYGAREEFILVMMLFVVTAIVAIVAFAIALALARTPRGIDGTALALLILVTAMIVWLALLGAGPDHRITVSADDIPILAEIATPTALMIAIQWWLVRRRWHKREAAKVAPS